MSTIDRIALERMRYLTSAKTRADWCHYVQAVERLRREREEMGSRVESDQRA